MKRNDFLKHVAWTGAGIAYVMSPTGVLTSRAVADSMSSTAPIDFVQISDSHIGFHQAANADVLGTLRDAVDAINSLPSQPQFVVHTGDVTHLSKFDQFDAAKQVLSTLRAPLVILPGEHDVIGDHGKAFLTNFPTPGGKGWYSWDRGGTHFVVLVNVFDFEMMGLLGNEQLSWLDRDLRAQKASTPVVVFTHVPLYALYPKWGWTTQDGAKALALLQRFDRVTVLNGHIHQVIRHTEGNITFASANATAYPQPAPGSATKPGPVTLPHGSLLRAIGYRKVELRDGRGTIDDLTLG